ncbi:MAG: amidase [Pseudomonadota bacterium]
MTQDAPSPSFAATGPAYSTLARGFAEGRTSPRDVLEQHLARLDAAEPTIRAFVVHDLDKARAAADAAAQRWRDGRPLSPIDGMPIGVKDIIQTADFPTRMNSPIFADAQPGIDAACVRAVKEGGGVIVGKTVTTEFAIGRSGPTLNPHDPKHTPGGSSSGSAASVGAGMVAAAFGTQTQGSIIRPAGFCGAVGFKPSHGALSVQGVHPLSETLDHLGVIADDVEDAWRFARWVAERAPGPLGESLGGPLFEDLDPVRPKRVGLVATSGFDELDATSRDAFDRLRARLDAAGVEVVEPSRDDRLAALVRGLEPLPPHSLDLLAFEMRWPFLGYREQQPDGLGPRLHELTSRALELSRDAYVGLRHERLQLRAQLMRLVDDFDAFILPSGSGPAPEGLAYTGSRTNLVYWTYLGCPCFSLPLMQVGHLPFGLQLAGFAGQDRRLARQAVWLMQNLPADKG